MNYKTLTHALCRIVLFVVIAFARSSRVFAQQTDEAKPIQKPNIVFFLIDDCSAHELACYGAPDVSTPNLDRLASEGVRFTTAWATPLCQPSRALAMTGLYAWKNGVYDNGLADWDQVERLPALSPMLSRAMKDLGYRTLHAGKWHLPGNPWADHWAFDEHWAYGSLGPTLRQEWIDRYRGKWWRWHNANELSEIPRRFHSPMATWHPMVIHNESFVETSDNDFGPEVLFDGVAQFIHGSKQEGKPFFIYYAEHLTHTPWTEMRDPKTGGKTPPGIVENVQYTDFLIGKLVRELKSQDVWDNTLLVVTGDNPTQGVGKNCPTAIGAQVPLLVGGGYVRRAAGTVSDALVDFADFYPTFLDAAGGNTADYPLLDGRSFAPLLRGEEFVSRPWIMSYLGFYRTVRNRDWCLDGAGRLWRTHPSGDPFRFTLLKPEEEAKDPAAQAGRRELEALLERFPPPFHLVPEDHPGLLQYEAAQRGEIAGRMALADERLAKGIEQLRANPERKTYHTD